MKTAKMYEEREVKETYARVKISKKSVYGSTFPEVVSADIISDSFTRRCLMIEPIVVQERRSLDENRKWK